MSNCPDDTELAGFLNESLTGERLGQVSGHVDGCPHCQARLDRLTDQTSGAVARYKELSSGVLPDACSNGDVATNDTQIIGGKPKMAAAFVGLPRVPGFDVAAEIGRGGMGVVYKARHRKLNRLVALKMILAGSAADPRVVQRFLFEAEVLARIQHPQVVQVFEVDTYEGPNGVPIPYLAMELLEGGALSRVLRENNTDAAPRWPSPRATAELIEGLARAVHSAHLRGVIHRDLKPGNILFTAKQGAPSSKSETKQPGSASRADFGFRLSDFTPKVLDFGLAKFREAGADLTQSGQVIGTPQYMAPEQAAGGKDIGPAADVYGLGAILFECLAGRPPFTGSEPMSVLLKVVNEQPPDVRSLRPEVPRDLAAVTMKCLEKDPARRYASAEALADDLRRFLDDLPTRARPVTSFERIRLWGKRNPAIAGLMAALAIVLLSAFVTVAALWRKAEQNANDERHAKTLAELAEKRSNLEAHNAAEAFQESQRQKALLEFDQAVTSCEQGRVEEGLRQFLRAAELAEQTGGTELARVARINVAAWPRELPPIPRAFAHKEQPRAAAFHPDGKRFVTAGRDAELYLWDIATSTRLRTYKSAASIRTSIGGQLTYWAVAINPDGNTIAAGGTDGAITLWNIDSDQPIISVNAVPDNLWALAFTSNGVLWSNDNANGLKRWDVQLTPKPTLKATPVPAKAPSDILQTFVVSSDAKRIYSGDRSGIVREWDTEKGVELRSWPLRGWISDVAVSADGKRLAATGTEGIVWVFDLASGNDLFDISLTGAYGNGIAFAPKQPYLIAADGDGNVRFWHRETGQPIGIPLRFHGGVTNPRFRPDSNEFVVAAGNSVYLSSPPDPPGTLVFVGRYRIRGLDFAPDGRLGVTDEATFELFSPLKHERLQLAPFAGRSPLTLRFDPDPARSFVYRGIRQGFDRLAVPNGQKPEEIILSRTLGKVFRIECLRGDGGLYAMGLSVVARYDPKTFRPLAAKRPDGLPPGVDLGTMAVRPDGKEVLVSFADRVVFLTGDTLEPIHEWRVGDEILDARYTPDGKKVMIGRRDNTAELLDAATGAATSTRPMTHTRAVPAVAISPDGKLLLTGSRDGTARFWDAATGLPLGAPLRHSGPVTHVAFSPQNDMVATGTGTGHALVWPVPPPPVTGTIAELKAKRGK